MATTDSYYPRTIDGRAHWWQVINDNALKVLSAINYPKAQIDAILADAAWAIYCYGTVHRFFQGVGDALSKYESLVLDSPDGTAMPSLPPVPVLPAAPTPVILAGIEARRVLWVQEVKKSPGCDASISVQLGIDTPERPFDSQTYPCDLFDLLSRGPHTVTGKFRKAGGHVDGINLYGRRSGTAAWQFLGRFNATPFTAQVPLTAGGGPEEWEFYAMAVKRDVEFGVASKISALIVRA